MPARELEKVVRLQDHVVELEERKGRLAAEPLLDGFEGEHAVDGEMAAVVAQELEVFEPREPVIVVHEHRVRWPVAKGEEAGEDLGDACDVLRDRLLVKQLARGVLAGWVTHLGRATADEHDRLVAALLEVAQQHDLQQAADVQARRGRVEPEVGDNGALGEFAVDLIEIGSLREVAAPLHPLQELGLEFCILDVNILDALLLHSWCHDAHAHSARGAADGGPMLRERRPEPCTTERAA